MTTNWVAKNKRNSLLHTHGHQKSKIIMSAGLVPSGYSEGKCVTLFSRVPEAALNPWCYMA